MSKYTNMAAGEKRQNWRKYNIIVSSLKTDFCKLGKLKHVEKDEAHNSNLKSTNLSKFYTYPDWAGFYVILMY